MSKINFCIALFFFSLAWNCLAQGVSGYVFDNATKMPLSGASVYFEGSTLGAISNDEGYFNIETTKSINSNLIISYLGYQDRIISQPKTPLKVLLLPALESLNEVVIRSGSMFSREEMLAVFRNQFLGKTRAGRACEIQNEEDIYLAYDPKAHRLVAETDQPIIVINAYLGYEIRFTLYDFRIDYTRNSLSSGSIVQTYYAGTTFYKDLDPDRRLYLNRRYRAYKGSILELMRVIATDDWAKKPYEIYSGRFQVDPHAVFKVKDTLGMKWVRQTEKITVYYNRKQQSVMQPKQSFTIDGYGSFYPPTAIAFGGVLGNQRLGDALPLDYGLDTINSDKP